MRRQSDREHGERTGTGRRARDRILAGNTRPGPALRERYELQNLILFLGDDLRESAIAVGGIEAFLLDAQKVLEQASISSGDLKALLLDSRVEERIDLLCDALSSLRRSIGLIHDALQEDMCYKAATK
ncbi:MAG: hypothetical protein HY698_04810 [Deltaproteobacteria bacterium]|nr:hypothetical protein [Deltaproteobacteria bacterium]